METDQKPISSAPKTTRYIGLAMLIFSLILILFLGTREWIIGGDRNGCIMNIRNVQQAIRGHQGMNSINDGAPIDWNEIIGPKGYLPQPVCPAGGSYRFQETFPRVGILACTCSHAEHVPPDHHNW